MVESKRVEWLRLVLHERFGHWFDLELTEEEVWWLRLPGNDGKIRMEGSWGSFPVGRSDFPCAEWRPEFEGFAAPIGSPIPVPGVSSLKLPLVESVNGIRVVHYNIPGLICWLLSRAEEVGRSDLDEHGRFPAVASHAFKHNYLERPLADEWLNILAQIIQQQWPRMQLKRLDFTMQVSHDVDMPVRYGFRGVDGLLRGIVGDVLRGNIATAIQAPWLHATKDRDLHPADPYNTFDWLMDQSENHGLRSAFYFICGRTDAARDADYEPEHRAIRNLMRRIHARGHEIGLHPSYGTYQAPSLIAAEANRLRGICAAEGIVQNAWGGRMHYLRWKHPVTMWGWELAGMSYDGTLGYADRPGFRCGTCFEYPAFDPEQNRALNLRIRPLVAMECSVIAKRYLGLGSGAEAFKKFQQLKDACRAVGGCFSLLWHNSELVGRTRRELFNSVIAR